jgi:hypothetical protein
MRSFLIAAAAFVGITAAPADAATRNLGITSFEKLRVEGPFKVTIRTGVAPYARAIGDQGALDRVAVEMRNNVLIIRNGSSTVGDYTGRDVGPVSIELGTHDLSSAWLTGSGSLTIDRVRGLSFDLSVQGSGVAEIGDAQVDQFSLALFGTASAKLAGRSDKMTADIRGVSSLDAAKLDAQNLVITADGASTISAVATDTAKVDATGPATIRLDGRPSCTIRVSGSADVSGCK